MNHAPAPAIPGADARLLALFQALADENRLRIVEVLRDGEHCVCDLQSALGLSQSLLSHHLRTLRETGLVRDRREGRWIHYALIPEAVEEIERWAGGLRTDAASPTAACIGPRSCHP